MIFYIDMTKKEELIIAAEKVAFEPKMVYKYPYRYSNNEDFRYSLWMCELQKWLRDIHGMFIGIECNCRGKYRDHAYNVDCNSPNYPKYKGVEDTYDYEFGTSEFLYNSYEEALENCLLTALRKIYRENNENL